MSSSLDRSEQLARLSEMAVNGRIIHKIDLIAMVKICGEHYFNVYRRYNSVYEIVVEDCHGDFYLQKDAMLRDSIGAVLCLSRAQLRDMYTVDLFSFRHGGSPPFLSSAPENMYWSGIQRDLYAVEIHLRGVLEEFHAQVQDESDEDEDQDDESDEDRVKEESEEEEEEEEDDEDINKGEDEDEYADMPALISDSEDEEDANEMICPYSDVPICTGSSEHFRAPLFCCKRTFMCYRDQVKNEDSESDDSRNAYEGDDEDDQEEEPRRGCGPDAFMILRNGTKYRKCN